MKDLPTIADDFVWTWIGDVLVNERVKSSILSGGISGCEFQPVEMPKVQRGRSAGSLWEIVVTGFAGFAKVDSGVTLPSWCDECGVYTYAFHDTFSRLLDIDKWDGSDMFRLWPFSAIICTERVRDLIDKNAMSGVVLIPIEEYDSPNRGAAPGLPSNRLSRAATERLYANADYILAIRKP